MKKQYFIIDFDSTFIKSEGLEELAIVVLKNNPKKKQILAQIRKLTQQGMTGMIPFSKSLEQRISKIAPRRADVEKLGQFLRKHISPSIARNKHFFKTYRDNIFIISGGFKEFIYPVVKPYGIHEDHIFANTFIFDNEGNYKDFDRKNLLSQDDGKVKLVQSFNLDGDIYVIGDGYTDCKLRELAAVKKFIAFTENIEREIVTTNADVVAQTFDEFLYRFDLPRSFSYPKSKIRVLLLESVHPIAKEIFAKEGYEVEALAQSLSEEELVKKISSYSILGIGSRTNITEKVVDSAERLLTIARFGIGVNNIDLKACKKRGIVVFNAPYSNTRSVVELALGEIMMLGRRIFEKSALLHRGIWDKSAKKCTEVRGKKLGIIGYGHIGSQLSVLAEMMGMDVIYYDIEDKMALGKARRCETLEKLLSLSDIISVHIDGRGENTNFIDEREFRLMKDGVIFINTSRGYTVNADALVKYINNGKIRGAGIDVFPNEPKSNDERFVSALQNLPNVILTPHIGGRSEEAQRDMGEFVPEKIINFINTGNTILSVNFPNLQLPKQGSAHRLIHIHKNVPGIMAKINGVFSDARINIVGQYLGTDADIGYVITDVNKKYDPKILSALKSIPNTRRFRVLY